MNILEATKSYEGWLGKKTILIPADLKLKHQRMREDAFSFLRATYYRWAQIWTEACADCAKAATVLAVGDLHIENFGTWRDVDGRLVWGVNDFDECFPLPFTNDLVRLAVSADLALMSGELALTPRQSAEAILMGYAEGLDAGGKPFVLADSSTPLRDMARERLNAPERFWKKFAAYSTLKGSVPAGASRAIAGLLPDGNIPLRFLHRIAGLGSLGKQRFTAVGEWAGGLIAREAKALTPSACIWAVGGKSSGPNHYDKILHVAVRSPDPMVVAQPPWLGRRLSPDCFRIELADLPKGRDETELLFSMGWETANVHLGTGDAGRLRKELNRLKGDWLHKMAKSMREATLEDWKEWKKRGKAP